MPTHRWDSNQGTDYIVNDSSYIGQEFKGFQDKNWNSKITNRERHYSATLRKICNIVGPETQEEVMGNVVSTLNWLYQNPCLLF